MNYLQMNIVELSESINKKLNIINCFINDQLLKRLHSKQQLNFSIFAVTVLAHIRASNRQSKTINCRHKIIFLIKIKAFKKHLFDANN